jgi:hypothetical protein
MARQSALPPNLPPRFISREAAAAYFTLAPGTFDAEVKAGRLPPAKRVSPGRKAWDVRELERAGDALPTEGASPDQDETWSDVDAT